MEILYIVIPISILLVLIAGATLWWAVERGQFEDLEGPAQEILMDDDSTSGESGHPPQT